MQSIKDVFKKYENTELRVFFKSGDIYVLYPSPRADLADRQAEGIWKCEFTSLIKAVDPGFKQVYIEGGYIDVLEDDIDEIWNHATSEALFVRSD